MPIMLLALMFVAPSIVSVTLDKAVCAEPCKIVAHITIAKTVPAKTTVCIAVLDTPEGSQEDHIDLMRQSCWPHTGYHVTDIHIRNINAGDYKIRVDVEDLGVASTRLMVR